MEMSDNFCLNSVVNDQMHTWYMFFPHFAMFSQVSRFMRWAASESRLVWRNRCG